MQPILTTNAVRATVTVEVITTDMATGTIERRVIDHDNFEDRKWLGKHCFWAMRNGRCVETRPAR